MSDPYADGGGPSEPRQVSAFSPDLPTRRGRREDAPSEAKPAFEGERPSEDRSSGDGQEAREDEYRATHADEPYESDEREPEMAMAEEPIEHRLARAFANGWREGFERGQWADRLDR